MRFLLILGFVLTLGVGSRSHAAFPIEESGPDILVTSSALQTAKGTDQIRTLLRSNFREAATLLKETECLKNVYIKMVNLNSTLGDVVTEIAIKKDTFRRPANLNQTYLEAFLTLDLKFAAKDGRVVHSLTSGDYCKMK